MLETRARKIRRICPICLICLIVLPMLCPAAGKLKMWGTPPQKKVHHQKSAAGVMMGPMPLLTQRRSETKRPPAPPKIIANLSGFGFKEWQGSPGSVDALLRTSTSKVDMWYGWDHLDIRKVVDKNTAGVRIREPILYMCAYYPPNLKDDERQALRDYVLSGGSILINCCGQDSSFAGVKAELKAMFPGRPLRLLPPDHPIYRSHFKVDQVSWPENMKDKKMKSAKELGELNVLAELAGKKVDPKKLPRLRAVTVGTRAAVVVSYEDLACGWSQWDNQTVARYSLGDSNALGVNFMNYVMAEMRFAKFLQTTHEIKAPNVRPRQQLTLVQLIHDGNWDPNPSGIPYLLRHLSANTSIAIKFARRRFELQNPNLFAYPLLYMTGTWNPSLEKPEVALLRRYLTEGGTLLADSASGRLEFDKAFRKLVKELFPNGELVKLPKDHLLYRCFYQIEDLNVNHLGKEIEPEVEAVFINYRPVIVYSPLGLCDGWALEHSAYARAYQPEDAFRLATNMIVYLMLTVRESGEGK